ncbi:class I adenylate-forming enzyme family protein [Caenimonas koreensis]|uniref:class I adenylate-forming enzyme family protein n=1 Tax=Caenimonas koreensis TaxID=367474 RepID=UPI0037847A77
MDAAPTPRVLADVLLNQARATPMACALQFNGIECSYALLAAECERAAMRLWHGWGVRCGDRVAWLGGNHPAQIALLFALSRIGAVLLPLNTRLAPAEWDAQLRNCSPRHLVHDGAFASAARDLATRHAMAGHTFDELVRDEGDAAVPEVAQPDMPALLVFTSGTTGQPKAAIHTQASLLANMRIAAQVQGITRQDVVATMLPLFHVGGLCIQTLPALYAGAKVILHPKFVPEAAIDCFEHDRPTLTLQVPATMKALIDHPRWPGADLRSLRAVWAGSSVLPAPLVAAFHNRGLPVCNVYGATETGPFSIALPPEHAVSHAGSCGWPAPGVEVQLAGVKGGVGEVLVRAPNVVSRYWPDEPACDEAGWFHTGDLASRAGDGSYTIVGRSKDLIISGGENIHPAEIEAALALHDAIAECAAFALPDDRWGEVVAVAVVRVAGAACTQEELAGFLAARLARFKLPHRWLFVDALPKTALGKVQRGELVRRISPSM